MEGWYALHQVLRGTKARAAGADPDAYREAEADLRSMLGGLSLPGQPGWTALARLVTAPGDLLVMHFRESFDDLAAARSLVNDGFSQNFEEVFTMVSVTEAGLYHLTAELARAAAERGGTVGDDTYKSELARKREAELGSDHVQRRLYPAIPADMPYVCFYPMSKRRGETHNWYTLPLEERSRLMRAHGETGRRYSGRVQQVITGAIGFSEWEWGVTLFAKDPLDFKKLVTDMRFDEVSAKYGEFGPFFVGKMVGPNAS